MRKNLFVTALSIILWLSCFTGFWLPDEITHTKVCHDEEWKTWFIIYGYIVAALMTCSLYICIHLIISYLYDNLSDD